MTNIPELEVGQVDQILIGGAWVKIQQGSFRALPGVRLSVLGELSPSASAVDYEGRQSQSPCRGGMGVRGRTDALSAQRREDLLGEGPHEGQLISDELADDEV